MKRVPTLSDVQRLTRARVCDKCPSRTPGTETQGCDFVRPCEARCELFHHLPVLYQDAHQLDPMVGHRPHVIRRLIRRVTNDRRSSGNPRVAARGYVNRMVNLFEELFP